MSKKKVIVVQGGSSVTLERAVIVILLIFVLYQNNGFGILGGNKLSEVVTQAGGSVDRSSNEIENSAGVARPSGGVAAQQGQQLQRQTSSQLVPVATIQVYDSPATPVYTNQAPIVAIDENAQSGGGAPNFVMVPTHETMVVNGTTYEVVPPSEYLATPQADTSKLPNSPLVPTPQVCLPPLVCAGN